MPKFDFSVKTRDGQMVESVQIYGKDMADAERKLRQMYLYCEVAQCRVVDQDKKLSQSMGIEEALSLIIKDD